MNDLLQRVRDAGVIGAGGAGFPTYVKLQKEVDYLIVNGAECEPLLDKDKELIRVYAREMTDGILLAAELIRPKHIVVGIKSKNRAAIEALEKAAAGTAVEIRELRDVYPAGDEYELVWEIARRQIPAGGIPLQVGCVVSNVETFYNIYRASLGRPVTRTLITVQGEVRHPLTFWAPVGMSYRDALAAAGGSRIKDYVLIDGGPMMGRLVSDPEAGLSRTSSGVLVLPSDHYLAGRYQRNERRVKRIGKSACDQCADCTMLCPRAELGIPLKPHLVMRSLGYSGPESDILNKWAQFCVECNICSLIACPENLDPKEACRIAKTENREKGIAFTQEEIIRLSTDVKPTKEYRLPPIKTVVRKLGLSSYYAVKAPFQDLQLQPDAVHISLKQHIGVPARPMVKPGDEVYEGDLIASVRMDDLGVPVHASIHGVVTAVTASAVTIERIS